MNRRHFLTGAVATALATGEIWTPSRTIFLPPKGGWPTTRYIHLFNVSTGHLVNGAMTWRDWEASPALPDNFIVMRITYDERGAAA